MNGSLEYSQNRKSINKVAKENGYDFKFFYINAEYEKLDDSGNRVESKKIKESFPLNYAIIDYSDYDQRKMVEKELAIKYLDSKFNNFYTNSKTDKHVHWKIDAGKEIPERACDYYFDFDKKEVVVLIIIHHGHFLVPEFVNPLGFKVHYKLMHIVNPFINNGIKNFYTINGLSNLGLLFDKTVELDFDFIDFKYGISEGETLRIFKRNQLYFKGDDLYDSLSGKVICSKNKNIYYDFYANNCPGNFAKLKEYYDIHTVSGTCSFRNDECFLTFYVDEPSADEFLIRGIFDSRDSFGEVLYRKKPEENVVSNIYIFAVKDKFKAQYEQWLHWNTGPNPYEFGTDPNPINQIYLKYIPKCASARKYFFESDITDEMLNNLIFVKTTTDGNLYRVKEKEYKLFDGELFDYMSANDKFKKLRFQYVLFLFFTDNRYFNVEKAPDYLKQLCDEGDNEAIYFYNNWKTCSNLKSLRNRFLIK